MYVAFLFRPSRRWLNEMEKEVIEAELIFCSQLNQCLSVLEMDNDTDAEV